MNDEELELAKAAAEGSAAGLLKSVHELALKLGGPAAGELGLMFGDTVRVWRLQNLAKLKPKVEAARRALGVQGTVPMRVLVPALENASEEDDESLQNKWALILARAATDNDQAHLYARFADTVRQLSPRDVRFLDRVASLHNDVLGDYDAVVRLSADEPSSPWLPDSLVVENCIRLGILSAPPRQGNVVITNESEQETHYFLTAFGLAFLAACRAPRPASPPSEG